MDNMHSKNKSLIYVLQAVVALSAIFLGGLIYILWRPAEPVFFEWIKWIGLENGLEWARNNYFKLSEFVPDWIIYSLPAGLWAFAYSFIIFRIWNRNQSILRIFWISTIPVLIFGFELLQLTNFLRGTYSFPDLVISALGILAGYFLALKFNKLR